MRSHASFDERRQRGVPRPLSADPEHKLNREYLPFRYKGVINAMIPQKCRGDSQFVTILPLARAAGYVTISSLKT
jgi:hypothetical protein